MFTKPFRVKSNTPLKGSDRKKLKAEIRQAFAALSDDELNNLIPNKEDLSVMKVETHSGEVVTVYLLGKSPIVFFIRDTLFPTVYFLWKIPSSVIPYFTTWNEVVPKFVNGADLMLPGIIIDDSLGSRAYGKLAKDTIVAVNTNKNVAAVAVGKTARSSEDMYMSAKRGKGIDILHCIGDYLWQAGSKDMPPQLSIPDVMKKTISGEDKSVTTTDIHPSLDSVECVSTDVGPQIVEGSQLDSCTVSEALETLTEIMPSQCYIEDGKNPQNEMDELLVYCFLKALHSSAKKVELPVLTSTFFRVHMVAACPAEKNLDVKKSSFKKLSKFLDNLKKDGIIMVKELSKGVESITDINYSHDKVRSFKEVELLEQVKVETAGEDKYVPPLITELFNVNATTLPLFSTAGYWKGSSLTAGEARKCVTEYIKKNQLQDSETKSSIQLDAVLSDVLLNKGEKTSTLTWEQIMSRCLGKMSPAFQLLFPNQDPILIKGKLEPIEISVATRAGNKKVTLVSGLETYRIRLEEFAHKCQVAVAASTTVTTSASKKGSIVLVQGNHVGFIGNLLIQEYGIPKQFIQGLDAKTKDKKK